MKIILSVVIVRRARAIYCENNNTCLSTHTVGEVVSEL